MNVVHFSYAADGGAGRAGRRANLACRAAGLSSTFSFVSGKCLDPSVVAFSLPPKANGHYQDAAADMFDDLQWSFIPEHRTPISNTLLSIPYSGADVSSHPAFVGADIIHLHWPTWGVTPQTLGRWLDEGRHVFWTLHDCWPMTGGCHYPAGCEQFKSYCMKCPQLQDDMGVVSNGFAERLKCYGSRGSLSFVAPSAWIAGVMRESAILRTRSVTVIRNSVETDIFVPSHDRKRLRAAFGIRESDLVLFVGSFDLKERRKGFAALFEAISNLMASGELTAFLPGDGRVFMAAMGISSSSSGLKGVIPLNFGTVEDDEVLVDVLSIADLACLPSLEDNYPNIIVEAFACGTPCLGTPIGGIPESIIDNVTGVLAEAANSVGALQEALLQFVREHFGSTIMRSACRTAVERDNDPKRIGQELRDLYESILGGSLSVKDAEMHGRMVRAFARSPVNHDTAPAPELLRFPTNVQLAERAPRSARLQGKKIPLLRERRGDMRLISVQAYHSHHSTHSGPYQFLRHLDKDVYEGTHLAVPLGTELSGKQAELYRSAGALLGTKSFGQQANGWMAEAEVLLQCSAEPIDLIHFIDGELGGWLMPMVPDWTFFGGRRPAIVTTFHQPPWVLTGMINADVIGMNDAVIVLCKSQQAALQAYVPLERIHLVPHGIDTAFFKPSPKGRGRTCQTFEMLLVGHWLRDLEAAFAAFHLVLAGGVDARLTIIAPSFPETRQESRVVVRSGLTDEELREAYWDADLVFIPLLDATANNAVLEAMACGRPLVTTKVGGVADAVGCEAGILCRPGDASALADAVIALAGDPIWREAMGHAGRSRALTLDWAVIASRHDHVYRAALRRSREIIKHSEMQNPVSDKLPIKNGVAPPEGPSINRMQSLAQELGGMEGSIVSFKQPKSPKPRGGRKRRANSHSTDPDHRHENVENGSVAEGPSASQAIPLATATRSEKPADAKPILPTSDGRRRARGRPPPKRKV